MELGTQLTSAIKGPNKLHVRKILKPDCSPSAHIAFNHSFYFVFLILNHSIGAHRIQGDGVVYRVNKIIMHAGFSMSHLRNDIALMRLVKPVQLGPKVGTVCFPRKNTRVATGTKCWISGLSSF